MSPDLRELANRVYVLTSNLSEDEALSLLRQGLPIMASWLSTAPMSQLVKLSTGAPQLFGLITAAHAAIYPPTPTEKD